MCNSCFPDSAFKMGSNVFSMINCCLSESRWAMIAFDKKMKWKIKRKTNDELRQNFIDMIAEQIKLLGMTLPDPDLKWNEERGHHDYGAIDWDEFWATVNGDGPCNKERLATRVKAWNEGQWLRDAALAHARKETQRTMQEAA